MKEVSLYMTVVAALFVTPGAWAHRYIENDGSHTSVERALPLGDINVSQVAYHEVTADTGQIWLRFDADAGAVASIELGVPKIDRYADYRPAYVLLGPGLPALENPPVTVPEGYGGIVFTSDDVADPEVFAEEFTGTDSWIFGRQEIPLPETGRYYIVGYVPSGEPGKFWIAPGTLEQFGFVDILTLPKVIYDVRTFHEVFFWGGLLGWAYLILLLIVLGVVALFFSL